MPKTLTETFQALKEAGKTALIPYVMGGDPDLEKSEAVVRALVEAGADIVELGIPFSDPLADGPAIQEAGQRALRKGVKPRDLFALVERLRGDINAPIIFMTYYNPIFRYGPADFAAKCAEVGVSGLIVPDLPLEESAPLEAEARKNGVDLIHLATPTSAPDRVQELARRTEGFLYYVSRTGVTGARDALPEDLLENVRKVRQTAGKPVAVGFGIKDADQAERLAEVADGVIIGSAIVRIVEKYGESEELADRLKEFVRPIADAVHGV